MSSYYTDSEINDYEEEKNNELFRFDTSLISSIDVINNWKQHIHLSTKQYLQKQIDAVVNDYNLFSCGCQVRAIAFCHQLHMGFDEIIKKYGKVYSRILEDNFDIVNAIKQLDQQLNTLVKYLQLVQANNAVITLYSQIQEDFINYIYQNLRKATDYCLDLTTLWLTLLTPKMFREQLKQNLYKVNYGGTLLYYQKQLSYLHQRIKRAQISNFSLKPKNQCQVLRSIALIINNQKLKQNLKTKIISLLKGQFYANIQNKSLKDQFIISSMQMYNGQEVSEIWDCQRYQNLCIQTLKNSFTDDQYLDCILYMEPENISFKRLKRSMEFAEIYYALIKKILHLNQKKQMAQLQYQRQQPLISINIPLKFIKKITQGQNMQLICHLFVNFLVSNKNAFSTNSPQLDKLFFGILEGMKQIYLSFGTNAWNVSTSALAALTNRFFSKFSEDIKDQIVNILPMMVKNLGEDKLPTRPYFVCSEQGQVKYEIKPISRSQYLSAIFYYIKDAEYKDTDFYLDLGQVNPTSLQTAIMFIKSLQLKLRHHEPTQDQKKLWTMIIQQAINHYKVKVDLKWFKPKKRLDVQQRQAQFTINRQIKQKWAYQLLQKILDFRDQIKYDNIVNNVALGQISLEGQLINYFKYALNINISPARWSSYIQDQDIFNLLDKMRTLLDINYGDILHLAVDELITLSQLHLCLIFYNTKVVQAKGNQIYMLIVHKIIIPWFESANNKQCDKFKLQFSQFFSNYIWKDFYLIIGDSLIKLLSLGESKQNVQGKLSYYLNTITPQTVRSNSLQNNAQFLQKIYSIIDYNTDVAIVMNTMHLVIKFIQFLPELQDQYISLGFFIDFLNTHEKIQAYMKKIYDFSYNEQKRLNFQLIKKLPDKLNDFNTNQIFKILQDHIDSEQDNKDPKKLLNILDQIPKNKNNLAVMCIKALLAEKYLAQVVANLGPKVEQKKPEQIKYFKYWKELQIYVKQYSIIRNKQEQQVNLAKICQLFQDTVFKKLKEDYKKILNIQNKKKSSKKKSNQGEKISMSQNQKKEQQNKTKQIQFNDKFKQAKIWRKVVQNFGTFQDIILFGEDPLQLTGSQQQQIYEECLKIIEQKTIQQKYLKRIIRKLPILQKCAQQAVKKITSEQNKQNQHIQPQFLCKLIMINSRYRSKIVQDFILKHISKIPIPVKIYQDYLIVDIKKKLQNCQKNILQKMLYQQLTIQDMRKIDQIFDQIVYMPIKKFQNVYLKFQNTIQQNQEIENQEWQTESQGKNDEESQQQLDKKKQNIKEEEQQQQQDQQDIIIDNDDDLDPYELQSGQDLENDEDIQDSEMSQYGQQQKIINMFYQQNDSNLPKYKQFIHLCEQINITLQSNYLHLQKIENIIKNDPELQKKIFRIVDILQNQISEKEIVVSIINKTPDNLYKIFRNYGLTVSRNEQKVQGYRKEVVKMPTFMNENMSQRDQNQDNDQSDNYDDQNYDDEDDLSEQTNSQDNMFDGLGDQMLFAINEQGQLQQINAEGLSKNQDLQSQQLDQNESQQNKMLVNLQKQTDDTLTLPQLKQINSKIQLELTGKQLSADEMVRIMQISIVKLFSLHSYQLKQKPVFSFYNDLINSKQAKIFIDTLFTVLRVDQLYTVQERFNLANKLRKTQLSLSKALNNVLQIAIEIATEQSKEGDRLSALIRDQVRALLPIGDQIVLKNDIPVQDHFLTLLIFYSRYTQNSIHEKTKRLLSTLYQDGRKSYQLTKSKAAILTKHIYLNNNSSTIWNNIQQRFGVKINKKVKFSSCLVVYGQLLREDIQKCYNDLLQIIKIPIQVHNEQQKKQAKLLIKQQEKKVEQNLKKHFKRIKHYYYWNKRNIIDQLNDQYQHKPVQLLKNKQLIKLTQLMIFYCHFLKQRFFQKIDGTAMKNLLILPKSVIEVSFMFLWKLYAKIDKWKPLSKVKQYFKSFKLYQHKFNCLEEVCNLVLEFLDIPQFSNSKFKQVIIPYFINNPEMANQIPLIFKLPDIPEQLNGQRVYLTRQCSFDMSFYQLVSKSISVEFHNQQGSDHGGMVRQFMMGWSGVGIGQQAVFLGKILAISFKKSIPFGGDFDVAMAVAITQHKVTIQFLENVDPEISESLKYIRDNDPEDLYVKFQITKQQYGIIKHYPLIVNGQQIAVTNVNKADYIKLFLQKYFTIGRQWQLSQLCTGFFSIVNKKYAAIFSPAEMIQKIQGQQIRDYTKLKNKTKYEEGYTQSSQMIKWFWQIVASFNQKQMNKFLQFITGAPKVSIYNHNFSFVIEKPYGENQHRLPVAHTCFNTLELPEYKTKQILQKKLTQAIYEGNDNFGIL